MDDDHCVVCRQRITSIDWLPFCCEICFDSDDAETLRFAERFFPDDWWDRPVSEHQRKRPM